MKKKIVIIGCFIAGFLLLMIPNVNSVEYNQYKELQEKSYDDILRQDVTWRPSITIQPTVDLENMTCDELQHLFWFTFIVGIVTTQVPFLNNTPIIALLFGGLIGGTAGYVLGKALLMDCQWAINIITLLEKLGFNLPEYNE